MKYDSTNIWLNIISWLLHVMLLPMLGYFAYMMYNITFGYSKHHPIAAASIVLCALILPLRYILFQASLGLSYGALSLSSFSNIVNAAGFLAIGFFLLPIYAVVGLIPVVGFYKTCNFFGMTLIDDSKDYVSWALILFAPFFTFLGTVLVFLMIRFSSPVFHFAKSNILITASVTGPTKYIFKYLGKPLYPISLLEKTSSGFDQGKDKVRAHVASIYVNEDSRKQFLIYEDSLENKK